MIRSHRLLALDAHGAESDNQLNSLPPPVRRSGLDLGFPHHD